MPDADWELLSRATIRRMIWGTDAEADGAAGSDEFGDGSFSGWTIVEDTSPNVTIVEASDMLSIRHPGGDASGELHGVVKAHTFSVGDYVETCIAGMAGLQQNYWIAGVVLADGSTYGAGNQELFYWSSLENNYYFSDHTNWNTPGISSIGAPNDRAAWRYYLRLEYDASNSFKAWVSPDGISWVQIGSAHSNTLTPTHGGVIVTSWSGPTIGQVFTFPYIKFGTV